MKTFVIFIVLLLFFVSQAFAARPLTTDDAGVVPISKYELELGYSSSKFPDSSPDKNLSLSIKHGLTEKVDFGIVLPYRIEPVYDEKFAPATFGLKFAIIKDVIAFTFSNVLGTTNYAINSIFSKDIGFLNYHINLGYNATGKQDEKGEFTYAFALKYPIEKFEIVAETFDVENSPSWLLGARYNLISEGLFVDIGYSRSFKDTREMITTGLHYEF